MNSRDKGGRGEREWRDILNKTFHTKYARTPMSGAFEGLKGDVRKLHDAPKTIADDFHWEIKRVEKLNIHSAMRQSIRDSRPPSIPCVPFRKNSEDWMICLRSSDFLSLLVELQELRKTPEKKKTDFENWVEKKETKREVRKRVQKKWKTTRSKK